MQNLLKVSQEDKHLLTIYICILLFFSCNTFFYCLQLHVYHFLYLPVLVVTICYMCMFFKLNLINFNFKATTKRRKRKPRKPIKVSYLLSVTKEKHFQIQFALHKRTSYMLCSILRYCTFEIILAPNDTMPTYYICLNCTRQLQNIILVNIYQ